MREFPIRVPVTLALLSIIAAALMGCLESRVAGGTGVGNPTKGSLTVTMQAASGGALAKRAAGTPRNPDGSFDIRDAGGTVFTVRSSSANVGRLKLSLPLGVDCEDADETECEANEVTVAGPFVADLMAGTWQPDPGAFRIPVGNYHRIDVRLQAADEEKPGTDPDLAGHSMIIKGNFAYAGRSDRAFTIGLDFDEDTRFQSDTGFALQAGNNRITIFLDVEKWLTGADITKCLDNGDLTLDASGNLTAIDSGACSALGESIKDAVKASGRMHGGHED